MSGYIVMSCHCSEKSISEHSENENIEVKEHSTVVSI